MDKTIYHKCYKKCFQSTRRDFFISDASPYGIGVHLCNKDESGNHVIMYRVPQKHYQRLKLSTPKIKKEVLGLGFGVKRFHKYLCGRSFTVITDSLPMKLIFGEEKSIPTVIHPRLFRWSLFLSGYDYNIFYI